MLVEDDLLSGRVLARALSSRGYRVRSAASGGEACALLPRARPDLIILDLILPDVDGLVLLMALKTMTGAPIMLCSARHGQVDRALGLRLGAADFVAKPFDLDDLAARVNAVLRPAPQTADSAPPPSPPRDERHIPRRAPASTQTP
jgi:DNA-binding response OmpR family regulator